jgi:hypothetical protein
MPRYKVSYKILRQQGDDMKAAAKLVDGYSERIAQVSSKLGVGDLLAQVRTNLGKLREQLGESRTVLNTAGEFLVKTVDNYTGVEIRQVKKADSTKAHNRDFYKNPVVVASVGGAAAGGAVTAAAPTPATPATTVNYTDNSVNVSYVAVDSAPVATPIDSAPAVAQSAVVNTAMTPASSSSAPAAAPAETQTAKTGLGNLAGIAAGAGAAGGALAAGAVIGVKHLMDENKKDKTETPENSQQSDTEDAYDPEAQLAAALERVRKLEEEG